MTSAFQALIKEAAESTTQSRVYANKKCKQCKGRGRKIVSTVNPFTGKWQDEEHVCECVAKTIRKALSDG